MQVNTIELNNVLQRIVKGCGREMSDGDSFIFHKDGIFTYNGSSFINAEFQNLGDFAVKTKQFLKFLSKNTKESVDMEVDYEKSTLTFKDKRKIVTFAINTEIITDISEYMPNENTKFTNVSEELIDALLFVAPSASKKELVGSDRIVLEYVHITKDFVEATTGNILARANHKEPLNLPVKEMYIKGADLAKVSPKNITEIGCNASYVFLKEDGILYGFRNIGEVKYVATDKLIQTTNESKVDIEFSKDFFDVLDNLIALWGVGFFAKMEVYEDKVVCTHQDDGVKFKETVPVIYKGEPVELFFNPKTLKDSLMTNLAFISNNFMVCENCGRLYIVNCRNPK